MPIGFRQRDPSGNVLVDITTRLPRIIGRANITASVNGSITVPQSGTNPIFYIFHPSQPALDGYASSPIFSIAGDTISWQYISLVPGYNLSGTLVYGRY